MQVQKCYFVLMKKKKICRVSFNHIQKVDITKEDIDWRINRAYDLLFDSILELDKMHRKDLIIQIIILMKKITLKK